MEKLCETVEEMPAGLARGHSERVVGEGNSMKGLIESGQTRTITAANVEQVKEHDIVFCRIDRKSRAHYMTHLVKMVRPDGYVTCNSRGRKNGVAKPEHIFGLVTAVAW